MLPKDLNRKKAAALNVEYERVLALIVHLQLCLED